jgi:hypothetical protein
MTPSSERAVGAGVLWKMTLPRSREAVFADAACRCRAHHQAPTADPIALARIP